MPSKRKHDPAEFTTDEAQTAILLVTEGYLECRKSEVEHKGRVYYYRYPRVQIGMCDREALEPASRAFGTKIMGIRTKKVKCPPHLYPPEGRGIWRVAVTGKRAERLIHHLSPILTQEFKRKWNETKRKCAC